MNTKYVILVVDDTEANIDILLELLGDQYDVLVALNGQDALDILDEESVDVVLLDIMMPEMDGYEVCRRIKSNAVIKDMPVIFITAKDDEESIENAYSVGGVDYVTKPFKEKELLARIETHIKIKSLIEHLDYIASHDQLTGIHNRRKFFDLAIKKFENESTDELFAVMIDIDKFKLINDQYGHPTGDEVIKVVANTISKQFGHDSIFGRIGGEEFAIITTSSLMGSVVEKVNILRQTIEELQLEANQHTIKFTVSNGIAQKSSCMNSIDDLMKSADKALYDAKGSGRNRVKFRSRS